MFVYVIMIQCPCRSSCAMCLVCVDYASCFPLLCVDYAIMIHVRADIPVLCLDHASPASRQIVFDQCRMMELLPTKSVCSTSCRCFAAKKSQPLAAAFARKPSAHRLLSAIATQKNSPLRTSISASWKPADQADGPPPPGATL